MSTSLAVRPKESLWSLEDDLEALLNSVDLVETDEERAWIKTEIAATLERTVAKRDQVSAWLGREEQHELAILAEIVRLEKLKTSVRARRQNIENYVLDCILAKGPDAKGKLPALEGVTSRFSAKKNPPSVEITAAEDVPEEYCSITLKFDPSEWRELADSLDMPQYTKLAAHIKDRTPSKTLLKPKLTTGEAISGARLAPVRYRLERE